MKTKWILLDVGDIVEDGDEEYFNDPLDDEDCLEYKWRPVAAEFVGEAVQEIDPPVRRKVKYS